MIHELLARLVKFGKDAAQEYYNILDEFKLLDFDCVTKDNLLASYDQLGKYYEKYRSKRIGLKFVDFNQGLDCRFVNEKKMKLMSEIAIRPLRIAFDDLKFRKKYINAIELAAKNGIKEFSNYILYNYKDHPNDLYTRLDINMDLCEKLDVNIYSFPMKFIPISGEESKNREYTGPNWNKKFIGAIQAIINVTKGIVAPPDRNGKSKSFFIKAFGSNLNEYKEILYMPETYIVYRKLFEQVLGLTKEWHNALRSLSEDEFETVRPIVEKNEFDKNTTLNQEKLDNFIKHYKIKRDDVQKEGKKYILSKKIMASCLN